MLQTSIQFCLTLHLLACFAVCSSSAPTSAPFNTSNSESEVANNTVTQLPEETSNTTTPPIIANYSEGSLEVDDCTCLVRETDSCTSLQDAIFTMYSELSSDQDTPYSFFTLKDLYYSEILEHRGAGSLLPPPLHGIDFSSQRELRLTQKRCSDLVNRYNLPTKDTERCRWDYECTQNQLHFPSFHVEAVLDAGSTGICTKVSMENRRFYRTKCRLDENLPHWLQCNCGSIAIGYKLED